jgi:hypothetical protein
MVENLAHPELFSMYPQYLRKRYEKFRRNVD